ncbi:M24 family metallopeptidase [Hippea jasoniae]|uniref:M24 family metallopeptidase n=1 Tax=Hippea jasoniae TaxID=944479 RepID=UPI000556024E|nr:aminopeptidase P family protein [Hippea jasoniae]
MNQERLNKLIEKMDEFNIDGVVLFNEADIRYFSNFKSGGVLIVLKDQVKLFTNRLVYEEARQLLGDRVELGSDLDDIAKFLKSNGVLRVGFDFLRSTYAQIKAFDEFEIVDFTNQTLMLRMIKDRDEINAIRKAAVVARNAFLKVYPYLKPGLTEKEIADELACQLKKHGAEKEAFDTIVATGPNAAYPHHQPTDRKIEEGDFVVIDFGAKVDGYHSDTTYTFLMGKKTDEKRELFNAVFYAQLYSTEMIAPSRTKASEVYKRAKSELAKFGLDKYFIHSLGHGIGLEVHEFPFLNEKNDMVIQPNMVFTIEPGIYIPGKLGIRLEHMVLVKENDTEVIAFTPFMEIM